MRLVHPLEAKWRGSSGATPCRISDISLTGCFVQSLAAPSVGTKTKLTIDFGPERSVTVRGEVVYTETGMGFAVKFTDLDDETGASLEQELEAVKTRPDDD
jgi:hypothetical protein